MNVVFVQSSSLSIERAHWIQILNTAWGFVRGGHRVVAMPRAFAPGEDRRVREGMGSPPTPNLAFAPMWPKRAVATFSLAGDPLSTRQGAFARLLACRALDRVLHDLPKSGGPPLVVTRDQEVPLVADKVLRRHGAVVLNELHKFEYVKRLEGKLDKKRRGRSTLS